MRSKGPAELQAVYMYLLSLSSLLRSDLDPIYYCELLRACPVKDDGDAHILSFIVKPTDVVFGKYSVELM